MKQLLVIGYTLTASIIFFSCGGSKKDSEAKINDLKTEIEKQKKEKAEKDAKLKNLEAQLLKIDSNAAANARVKLISIATVSVKPFEHFIDLTGRIDADNISYISPRMGPGQVKAIYVRQGQYVKKGQLVLKLDDAIQRQSVQAAQQGVNTIKQSLEGVKTQLNFARNLYARQKNLWDQGIGTEVQLITARTNVEGLEKQLLTMQEQVKQVIEQKNIVVAQQNTANIYSDVNGIVDQLNIKVGETFSGMGIMGPQIKIVNRNSLKVTTNVPENYGSRIRTGSPVTVTIADAGINNLPTNISLISQSVDANLRGFMAESRIPSNASLKPNQTAVMRIKDYSVANAVVIPVNMVQTDEAGKYVFVMLKSSNGKTTAHKIPVVMGEVYGDNVEIKSGLVGGEQLITEGYQGLYEGQLVSSEKK